MATDGRQGATTDGQQPVAPGSEQPSFDLGGETIDLGEGGALSKVVVHASIDCEGALRVELLDDLGVGVMPLLELGLDNFAVRIK